MSTSPHLSRRHLLAGGLALASLAAVQPAVAAGSFPTPGPFPPRDALLTYADMIKALEQIERTSRGAVQVHTLRELGITPGVSEAGRDLYVATVGSGDTHVWLQGRIHGNEPYGTDSLLDVLRSVSSNGNPTFRRIREELTLHVIPMYNPDGSELYIRHTVLQDARAGGSTSTGTGALTPSLPRSPSPGTRTGPRSSLTSAWTSTTKG